MFNSQRYHCTLSYQLLALRPKSSYTSIQYTHTSWEQLFLSFSFLDKPPFCRGHRFLSYLKQSYTSNILIDVEANLFDGEQKCFFLVRAPTPLFCLHAGILKRHAQSCLKTAYKTFQNFCSNWNLFILYLSKALWLMQADVTFSWVTWRSGNLKWQEFWEW